MKTRSVLLTAGLSWALVLAVAASLVGLASAGVARAAPPIQAGDLITVIVQPGDHLGKYAMRYGVSGSSLRAANPQLKDPNLIFPGQTITIPVVRSFEPSLTTPFFYVVQPGDRLANLGLRFEMDSSVIAVANGIQKEVVVAGQTLLIPAGPHLHRVVAGETLRSIAQRYGTTVQFLLTGNSLPDPDRIYIDQPIFIPVQFNAAPRPITPVPALAPATATTAPGAPPAATAAPGATPVPTAIGAENFIQVTVRAGESFLVYSQRYGVTGGRLRAANPQIADPSLIFPGQTVIIPVPASFNPSRTTPFFYAVQGGESMFTIAAKFEMAADTLQRHNPGASFAAGTTILVPAGPHVYTVRQGDTLASIAAKYGTTVQFLLTGNTLPDPNAIFLGQQIFVPIQYNRNPVGF